jgi:hypothetical protein
MKRIIDWFVCKFTTKACKNANIQEERFDFAGVWRYCTKCGKDIYL